MLVEQQLWHIHTECANYYVNFVNLCRKSVILTNLKCVEIHFQFFKYLSSSDETTIPADFVLLWLRSLILGSGKAVSRDQSSSSVSHQYQL